MKQKQKDITGFSNISFFSNVGEYRRAARLLLRTYSQLRSPNYKSMLIGITAISSPDYLSRGE